MVVFAAAATWPSAAHAQDRLASIITKAKLTGADIAQIEAVVPERARKLSEAGANEKERTRARDSLLSTPKTQGASKAGLDAYAEACATSLGPLAASETFAIGFETVDILTELDNANTAGALTKGLTSPHPAVRYKAARALRLLHGKIKNDGAKCKEVLDSLAVAGATERDAIALAAIYEAFNFYPNAADFKFGADCAAALNKLLEGRLKRLRQGGLDESQDLPAFDLAAACQAAAQEEERLQLVHNLTPFVTHAVRRYLDGQTSDDSLQSLSTTVKRMEGCLHTLIKASNKSVPKASLAEELASKAAPDKKREAVRSALDELMTTLKGEPWNLG